MSKGVAFPSVWVLLSALVCMALLHATLTVDGVATLVLVTATMLSSLAVALWLLGKYQGGKRAPISRPVDYAVVLGFVAFAVVAVLVDAVQAGVGPGPITDERIAAGWQPINVMRASFKKWVADCDHLLGANPLWYWVIAILSPVLYLPFYMFAIYAFLYQREWIRDAAIIWGSVLSSTTTVVILDEIWGPHPSPNVKQMLPAYLPWVIFPILVIVRVWKRPIFAKRD